MCNSNRNRTGWEGVATLPLLWGWDPFFFLNSFFYSFNLKEIFFLKMYFYKRAIDLTP